MKKLFFVLLLSYNLIVYSQRVITGRIINENNLPLDSVKVSVKDTNLYVYSDKKGIYVIEIPKERKVISFEKKGYIVKEIEVKKDVVNITMTREVVSIFDLTLEELLALEVKVASQIDLPLRESPGIVSVITKDEIKNAGCRDMIDVLRLVPGIEFGVDVQGVTSIIMRGNWAHEGKVLLMLDGIVLNELSYSTIQLGHHICVDQIERVEIIRGPGSAIYGGYAEMGVINIITKDKNNSETFRIGSNYGHMKKTYGHRNIFASFTKAFSDKYFIKLHSFVGQATRSERVYTDIFGNQYDMTHQSALEPMMINFQTKISNFTLKVLYDNYKVETRDNFERITSEPYTIQFNTFAIESHYDFRINYKLTITPRFNFKYNRPWHTLDKVESIDIPITIPFNNINNRYTADLTLRYDINDKINFLGGAEYYKDLAFNLSQNYDTLFWNKSREIHYNNVSVFGQIFLKSSFANITIGVRAEKHSQYQMAFAPRIALTRAFQNFHLKLLLSSAFRSPGIQNIDLNAALSPKNTPDIKPEKLYTSEFEVGYKICDKMHFSTNLFLIYLFDPIIYYIDNITYLEGYKNVDPTGTKGFEFEYKYLDKKLNINFNLSYYDSRNINKVADYSVENNPNLLLGAPQLKINLSLQYLINKNLNVFLGNTYLSSRYGYTSVDNNGNLVLSKFSPVNLLNLFINYDNLLFKNFCVGVGVHNLLDTKYNYIQPYSGWHAPLPSGSREFSIKLSWGF